MKNMQFLLKLLGGTVVSAGSAISVIACNNNAATAIDISSGVSISDLRVATDLNSTYQDLNNNTEIVNAVAAAIKDAKNVDVTPGTDFTIGNDQIQANKQSVGDTVVFTVTARGTKISGGFSFTETLSKPDISMGVKIADPMTGFNPGDVYDSLNDNASLISAVSSAINTAKNVNVVSGTDFVLSNDQDPNAMQTAGKVVMFTVTAMGSQITGSFTFTNTLGKADISSVVVNDLQTGANPGATYANLNNNQMIIKTVADSINNSLNTTVTGNDFTITNDQDPNANQVVGTVVNFTVTGKGNQIKGSFNFTDTLSKTDISKGVIVSNLMTPATIGVAYSALNNDANIVNAVINAINTAKNVTVTANDFTLTNDQAGTQLPNTVVKFTVTGTGDQLTGSFSFVDVLSKVSIASGITIADPLTNADPGLKYGDLNNNSVLLNTVATAINAAKGTTISTSDISLTNDQTATNNQTAGQVVKFTVTGVKGQVTGSFTFTDTLQKANISSGVVVNDPQIVGSPTATYGALNTNTTLQNAVISAIYKAKNVTVTASDFTLTNNRTATANQVLGSSVTFTVTATPTSNLISGSFTFSITLGKISISSGVTVADLQTTVSNGTYGSLNSNTTIQNAVIAAISASKGVTVVAGTDFTLSNNQVATSQMGAVPVVFTVTAVPTSTLISGSFSFTDTLAKVALSTGSVTGLAPSYVVNTFRSFGDILTYPSLLVLIANSILANTGAPVSATYGVDFTLYYISSVTLTGTQAAGSYTIGIVATPTSLLISGSTSFTLTITAS